MARVEDVVEGERHVVEIEAVDVAVVVDVEVVGGR
jgi:hypothetical protein